MTQEQKIIRVKVGLLELAKQLGNVSQACKMMGYSRDNKDVSHLTSNLKNRFAEPCPSMPVYAHANSDQIASAIGMEVRHVAKHGSLFEAAAIWHRVDRRRPTRVAP